MINVGDMENELLEIVWQNEKIHSGQLVRICDERFSWKKSTTYGEWGEIVFDFENSTAEIVRLADWDTMISNMFAKQVIRYLLDCENEKLPKETMFAFEP